MDPGLPWPRSRAAIGVAVGAAAWVALAVLDARGDGPDVSGYLLRALAASPGPARWLPIAAAGGAAAAHGAILRRNCGRDAGCWQDAAVSFGCLAVTLLGWAWAIHHTPFTDPLSLPPPASRPSPGWRPWWRVWPSPPARCGPRSGRSARVRAARTGRRR